jgi:hypothetical protein
MPQVARLIEDAARDAEIRDHIGRRPIVMRLAEVVACWEDRGVHAMQRGDWELAAGCQERAAVGAHQLGLLEDRLFEIYQSRGAKLSLCLAEERDSGTSTARLRVVSCEGHHRVRGNGRCC